MAAGQPTEPPMPDASFLTIVHMLGIQAMVALGEIANPVTKSATFDERHAKWQLASLEVLARKTIGNLDEQESRALENVLFEVRTKLLEKLAR